VSVAVARLLRVDQEPMRIDCGECAHQGTDRCDDCVVTFILEREEGAVVVDAEEALALRRLGEVGLVPLLQLSPRPPGRLDREVG
jgi:hypothetical protein